MKKLLLTLLVAVLSVPAFAAINLTGLQATNIPASNPAQAQGSGCVVTPADADGTIVYLDGFFNRSSAGQNLGAMSAGLVNRESTAYLSVYATAPLERITLDLTKDDSYSIQSASLISYTADTKNAPVDEVFTKNVKPVFVNAEKSKVASVDLSNEAKTMQDGSYLYVFRFDFYKVEGEEDAPLYDGDALAVASVNVVKYQKPVASLNWPADFQKTYSAYLGEDFEGPLIETTTPDGLRAQYVSTNPSVATVTRAGAVTLVKAGTTEIYAQATYNGETIKSTPYKLNVYAQAATLTWGSVDSEGNQDSHGTVYFTETSYTSGVTDPVEFPAIAVDPENVGVVFSLAKAINGVSLTSSGNQVTVNLDPTKFQPAANGTDITINVKVNNANYTAATAQYILTVMPTIAWPTGTNASYDATIGSTTFKAPVAAKTSETIVGEITYASSDTTVANFVNKVLTLKGVGTTTITANLGNTTISYVLNVNQASATLLFASNTLEVGVGRTVASPTLSKAPANVKVKYTSEDTSIATVDETTGMVTGEAVGTTTITASIDDPNYTGSSASYTVTVVPTYDDGTIVMNTSNTTIRQSKANLVVAGVSQTIPAEFSGIEIKNGKFEATADNATITFPATAGYDYKTLKVAGASFTVRTSPVAKGSPAYTQEVTSTDNSATIIPQPDAFYRIIFSKGATFDGLTFTPSEPVTLANVDAYEILASEERDDKDVLIQRVAEDNINGYSSLYPDGQLVRVRFLSRDLNGATVYYAFLKGSGTNSTLLNLTTQTWDEAFKQQLDAQGNPIVENGQPVCSVIVDPSITKDAEETPAKLEQGKFKAYLPGTFLLLNGDNKNGTFYYFTEKDNEMSPVRALVVDATVTGIEEIVADEATGEAVYYNLQGVQIANPTPGQVYVRVIGKKADKVVFK